jgi:hypothetical protein
MGYLLVLDFICQKNDKNKHTEQIIREKSEEENGPSS